MTKAREIFKVNPLHEDIMAYAASYTCSRDAAIGSDELRRFGRDLMNAVSRACLRRGAKVIGHIKAYLEYATGFLHTNTVGDPADVTVSGRDGEPVHRFTVVVNTIVYGLGEAAVRDATEEAIAAVTAAYTLKKEPGSQALTRNPI